MHIIIKVNFLMLEWIVNVDFGASDAPSEKKRYLGLRQLAFCFTADKNSRVRCQRIHRSPFAFLRLLQKNKE